MDYFINIHIYKYIHHVKNNIIVIMVTVTVIVVSKSKSNNRNRNNKRNSNKRKSKSNNNNNNNSNNSKRGERCALTVHPVLTTEFRRRGSETS